MLNYARTTPRSASREARLFPKGRDKDCGEARGDNAHVDSVGAARRRMKACRERTCSSAQASRLGGAKWAFASVGRERICGRGSLALLQLGGSLALPKLRELAAIQRRLPEVATWAPSPAKKKRAMPIWRWPACADE